jgi:hypothetical protein
LVSRRLSRTATMPRSSRERTRRPKPCLKRKIDCGTEYSLTSR